MFEVVQSCTNAKGQFDLSDKSLAFIRDLHTKMTQCCDAIQTMMTDPKYACIIGDLEHKSQECKMYMSLISDQFDDSFQGDNKKQTPEDIKNGLKYYERSMDNIKADLTDANQHSTEKIFSILTCLEETIRTIENGIELTHMGKSVGMSMDDLVNNLSEAIAYRMFVLDAIDGQQNLSQHKMVNTMQPKNKSSSEPADIESHFVCSSLHALGVAVVAHKVINDGHGQFIVVELVGHLPDNKSPTHIYALLRESTNLQTLSKRIWEHLSMTTDNWHKSSITFFTFSQWVYAVRKKFVDVKLINTDSYLNLDFENDEVYFRVDGEASDSVIVSVLPKFDFTVPQCTLGFRFN